MGALIVHLHRSQSLREVAHMLDLAECQPREEAVPDAATIGKLG